MDAALKSASLDWPIRPFLWSGANSVHARYCAARELSDQLTTDLQGDPDARAVIIAHSHGGNVALRALQHLNSMAGQIEVVTMATPFLRVFARRSLQLPMLVKFLVFYAAFLILSLIFFIGGVSIAIVAGPSDIEDVGKTYVLASVIVAEVLVAGACIFITRRLIAIFTNAQAARVIEEEASYDTKGTAAPRMLVIRGVDDEASLSLAAGSIGSRLSYLMLVGALPAIYLMSGLVIMFVPLVFSVWPMVIIMVVAVGAPIFLVLPGVFTVFCLGESF